MGVAAIVPAAAVVPEAAAAGVVSPLAEGGVWELAGRRGRLRGLARSARGAVRRTHARVSERLSYALGDQVVYSFGNMVVAALLSRHAPQREFGIYILTQRALDVLVQCCNTLSWAPFTFRLAGTEMARRRSYRGSVLLQQVFACGVAAVLLWLLAQWASSPGRGVFYGTFHPLVFTSAALLFREFNRRMYFADMRMREAFWTEIATVGLQIAGVEWCWRTHRLDVAHTLMALSGGAAALSVWWCVREARTLGFRVWDLLEDTRENVRLGRWFLGSNLLYMAGAQANPWLLSAVLGGGGVGAYAVCESVVNIPRVALVSFQNIFAPVLSRAVAEGGKPRLREVVRRIDRMLLMGSAVCAAGIVLLGPWVARLIFKQVPDNARVLLLVLALNFVAFASTLAQSYGLSAIGRAGPTFYANAAGLAAQAACAMWLVHTLAIPGAAAAMLVGSVVVMAVRQVYFNREVPA